MYFICCVMYLAAIGMIGFVAGRLLPKSIFSENVFPFKSFEFEENGKFYEKFKIRLWKDKLIDMSKIFPQIMPIKQLRGNIGRNALKQKMPVFIKETCIAEFTHTALAIAGFGCMKIWDGLGGVVVSVLFALGNIPFIMVQRYNRPRFMYILNRKKEKTETNKSLGSVLLENASVDIKL